MKPTLLTSAILLVFSATAQYTNQSEPFHLQILSDQAKYNGTLLSACHEGAVIEGLCAFGGTLDNVTTSGSTFQFNTSTNDAGEQTPSGGADVGYLTYELQGAAFNISEPLVFFFFSPVSNVASLLFWPDSVDTVELAFDAGDRMTIPWSLDDSVSPPDVESKTYYRWYICDTNIGGYSSPTLNSVFGNVRMLPGYLLEDDE